eukprot:Hpha_TRINITY_DN16954_c0_g6::TRINITY_DN16954_c0_g6_i1::g.56151::m.56151
MALVITQAELVATGERGMHNRIGLNNCFLNSVLQALWHHVTFREAYLKLVPTLPPKKEGEGPQLLTELGEMLAKYSGEKCTVNPKGVRDALAKREEKFKSGQLSDAHECFSALLEAVHEALVELKTGKARKRSPSPRSSVDALTRDPSPSPHKLPPIPNSLVHQHYGLHLVREGSCENCKAVVYKEAHDQFYSTVWASEIYRSDKSDVFVEKLVCQDEPRSCDACEKGKSVNHHTVRGKLPSFITVHVAWSSEKQSRPDLISFFSKVPGRFKVKDAYNVPRSGEAECVLTGLVFFFARHYVSAFFNSEKQSWVIFDDTVVKAASPNLQGLWKYCVSSAIAPSLLFYTNSKAAGGTEEVMNNVMRNDWPEGEPALMSDGVPNSDALADWLKRNTRSDMTADELASHQDVDLEALRRDPAAVERLFRGSSPSPTKRIEPPKPKTPPRPKPSQEPVKPKTTWACPRCTLENEKKDRACQACETENPDRPRDAVLESDVDLTTTPARPTRSAPRTEPKSASPDEPPPPKRCRKGGPWDNPPDPPHLTQARPRDSIRGALPAQPYELRAQNLTPAPGQRVGLPPHAHNSGAVRTFTGGARASAGPTALAMDTSQRKTPALFTSLQPTVPKRPRNTRKDSQVPATVSLPFRPPKEVTKADEDNMIHERRGAPDAYAAEVAAKRFS